MNAKHIESKFAAMGARLKLREIPSRWRQGDRSWISPADFAVDIQRDGAGEFFELRVPTHLSDSLDVSVMQAEPKQRHLLLAVRTFGVEPKLDRFLCGHDEREWFVAAVPGGASSVRQAMDALQPQDVRDALAQNHVSSRKRYARKNRAFRRQGEWFFVPESSFVVDEKLILRNEAPPRSGQAAPRGRNLPQRRRDGSSVRPVSERRHAGRISRHLAEESQRGALELARDATQPGRLRARHGASQRPRHHHIAVLASGHHEH